MQRSNSRFYLGIQFCAGFDHEQYFCAGLSFTLPLIYRGQARDDIDAGGQALIDEGIGYCCCGVLI